MGSFFNRSISYLAFMGLLVSSLNAAHAQSNRMRKGSVQITPYKTTFIANGKDELRIRVVVINAAGDEINGANNLIRFSLKGDAKISKISPDNSSDADRELGDTSAQAHLVNGILWVTLTSGTTIGHLKLDAKSDTLWTGSTEIHEIQPGKPHKVTTAIYTPERVSDKIIGADISFLPELESRGMKFSDKGTPGDPMEIMHAHGFNYIRLRIFVDPSQPKGYSPNKGFCDLAHTEAMAKRIKAAGMKFLLDFHYSDYWADPQQQNKPSAWVGQDFPTLKRSLRDYTVSVMKALKDQGTTPDMVQVGNEINHGMVWPEGAINNLDSLAQLIYAGVTGVKEVSPSTTVMLHIALGGQNEEARFFLDNMKARNVPFDVIGLSYYPRWHGTLEDLKNNMADLAKRYPQQVMVAEYSQLKREVNDIAFNVPNGKAVGTFIWEPLSSWEGIFDRSGKANDYMDVVYPEIAKKYHIH
ncbi:MAG: glycosyl hydrolase 53 family protein [Bacteroidetes bacterium]|nr:glycosyl hydrolase 53 family protein [Bacteroidota bacterium]